MISICIDFYLFLYLIFYVLSFYSIKFEIVKNS
jgi:hypothetical protein